MHRWCSKLRSLAALHSTPQTQHSLSSSHRLLHSSSHLLHKPIPYTVASSNFNKPLFNASMPSFFNQAVASRSSLLPLSLIQVRHIAKSVKRMRMKRRKPMTPVTSKIKKIKMKSYSSYKGRFRTLNDGTIRRWKAGRRHNAHLKSKQAKRRLRLPGIVPAAYAKVMKKLNFCG